MRKHKTKPDIKGELRKRNSNDNYTDFIISNLEIS